jgi:hypothetical protein
MKSIINPVVALAALILATGTALPAFAAPFDQGTAPASVETVQYRQHQQTQHRTIHRRQLHSGYHAYAAEPRSAASSDAHNHNMVHGWPCAYRDESSAYSAFPSWELCN